LEIFPVVIASEPSRNDVIYCVAILSAMLANVVIAFENPVPY
jgi:hypothetical protein